MGIDDQVKAAGGAADLQPLVRKRRKAEQVRPGHALVVALLLVVAAPFPDPAAAAKQAPVDDRPAADAPPVGNLTMTQPGHLPGRPVEPLVAPGPYLHLPSIDESVWVVAAVRDQPFWKAGIADPVLTEACRLGEFGSFPLNRIVVKFTGKGGRGLLQVVAPAYRHLLFDRRGLARPNEIYYFHDTGLPSCDVWVEGETKPRAFARGRGTELPPPDRSALKNRLAQINGWPKQTPAR